MLLQLGTLTTVANEIVKISYTRKGQIFGHAFDKILVGLVQLLVGLVKMKGY